MKITRLFTGSDQQSYFEEIDMDFCVGEFGKISAPIAARDIMFGEIDDFQEVSWHNPPCKQYIIMLHGNMEIETGDGSKRIFNEGDVLLAEDTTGQGHVTRAVKKGMRRYLVIPLKGQ